MDAPVGIGRWSTVHDLTSLRLHPDNSRASGSSRRKTVKDGRGNVIANNAAKLPRRKPNTPAEPGDDDLQREASSVSAKGKEREVIEPFYDDDESGAKDSRSQKRRKYDTNYFDFLDIPQHTIPHNSSGDLPLPSSDLLKTIHHFASQHYAAREQLLNGTREVRQKRASKPKGDSQSGTSLDPLRDAETIRQKDDHDQSSSEDDSDIDVSKPKKYKKHKKGHEPRSSSSPGERDESLCRDMYKALDGSALLAIGMVVQEQLASLLAARVPDGWMEEWNNPALHSRRRRKQKEIKRHDEREDSEEDNLQENNGSPREIHEEAEDRDGDKGLEEEAKRQDIS